MAEAIALKRYPSHRGGVLQRLFHVVDFIVPSLKQKAAEQKRADVTEVLKAEETPKRLYDPSKFVDRDDNRIIELVKILFATDMKTRELTKISAEMDFEDFKTAVRQLRIFMLMKGTIKEESYSRHCHPDTMKNIPSVKRFIEIMNYLKKEKNMLYRYLSNTETRLGKKILYAGKASGLKIKNGSNVNIFDSLKSEEKPDTENRPYAEYIIK